MKEDSGVIQRLSKACALGLVVMFLVASDDRVMGTLVFSGIGAAIVYSIGIEAAVIAAGKLVGVAVGIVIAFMTIATVVGLVTVWLVPRIEDKQEVVRSAK